MTAQGRISPPSPSSSVPASPVPEGRLPEIQILRALAAGLVVLEHTRDQLGAAELSWPTIEFAPGLGAWGVDLFFIISGYIIARTAARAGEGPAAASVFLWRRLLRILPTYWLWSLLWFAWIALRSDSTSWLPLAKTFTVVPVFDTEVFILPVLFVGWSLAYEMLFYLAMSVSLAVKASPRHFLGVLAGLAAGLSLVATGSGHPILTFLANPLWLEFALGLALAHHEPWLRGLPKKVGGGLLVGGFTAWLATGWYGAAPLADCLAVLTNEQSWARLVQWGLPAAAVAAGALILGAPSVSSFWIRSGVRLGDASYAWYLTHLFALLAAARLWRTFDWSAPAVFLILAFGATILLAWLAYHYVEQPLNRFLTRKLAPRSHV